jgi:sugar lactone lactonase YvrE
VWGAGVVRRFNAEAALVEQIAVPSRNLTCPVFGGTALDQLFVTSSRQEMTEDELNRVPTSGGLFLVRPNVTGIPDALFSDR